MSRPITVEMKVPETSFGYDESDAEELGQAATQALVEYVNAGGDLDVWLMRAEPYELQEGTGVRLWLEGEERE